VQQVISLLLHFEEIKDIRQAFLHNGQMLDVWIFANDECLNFGSLQLFNQ